MGFHAVYYDESFVLSKDDFDTTRKAAWIAKSLGNDPIPGVQLHSPNMRQSMMLGVSILKII